MKRKLGLIALMAASLFAQGSPPPAFSGHDHEMAANDPAPEMKEVRPYKLDKDLQWIVTIHFVNAQSEIVKLNYRVYEKGRCTRYAMILMETLKRKMAEKGYMYRKTRELPETSPHEDAIFIVADTGYSKQDSSMKRKEGNMLVIVWEKEALVAVDVPVEDGKGLEYGEIESLADDIMARLLRHSYI